MYKRPDGWALFFAAIAGLWITTNLNWGGNHWRSVLESDAKGYFAYLPAWIVYHDLNFGFFEEIEKGKYYDEYLYYDYRQYVDDNVVNKYYSGTALVQLPFYLIAHAVASDKDGYSRPYMLSVTMAAWFYLMFGLFFLQKLMRTYRISHWSQFWVILATFFGTNLFYYVLSEPGMSHVYSFGFVSLFMYLSRLMSLHPRRTGFLSMGLILGIVVLIRPVNLIVILTLPFMAESKQQLQTSFQFCKREWLYVVLGGLLFSTVVFIQLWQYKISTGQWWVYSYGKEGFDFTNPHFLDILFSYKKGLFLYTPLYFLGFLSALLLWNKSRFKVSPGC